MQENKKTEVEEEPIERTKTGEGVKTRVENRPWRKMENKTNCSREMELNNAS